MKDNLLLIGCGILKKEIGCLIKKNKWLLDTVFLDSALHIDFGKLSDSLTSMLEKYAHRDIIVFYGSCHPLMENMLLEANTHRTLSQNCAEMLLGPSLFTEELSNGAFFLMEDWAHRWNFIITKTFGTNESIVKEIFRGDRKYLLALRTPCSSDFTLEASAAGKKVDLPVRWMDVSLDQLEIVLQAAITKKMTEIQ
jgi:hypothetical protein